MKKGKERREKKMKNLNNTFKKIISCLLALVMTLGVFTVATFSADEEPELKIAACTLSLNDSIYIKYAVTGYGSLNNVKLLVWTAAKDEYTYGTQTYTLDPAGTTTVSGKSALVFQYTKLAAKQMGDYVYARAYVENGDSSYYSPVKKYSVLQYIYNKLGKTGTASSDQNLINLLNAMLHYGEMAQIYFGYKTSRLVTADWYQIKVVGGTLSDGCDSGLFLPGDTATFVAPETNEDGEEFSYWQNGYGTVTGTTQTVNVTVGNENAVYTAVFGETIPETPETGDYYQISVIGGTLSDGSESGLFLPGDTVTITAPAKNSDGEDFSCWVDESGAVIGTTATITITVGTENKTFTAVYGVNVGEDGRYIESVDLEGTELIVYYNDGTTENVDASNIVSGESTIQERPITKDVQVGDIVTFGKCEQDANFANGYEPVEWIVAEIAENGRTILISNNSFYSELRGNIDRQAIVFSENEQLLKYDGDSTNSLGDVLITIDGQNWTGFGKVGEPGVIKMSARKSHIELLSREDRVCIPTLFSLYFMARDYTIIPFTPVEYYTKTMESSSSLSSQVWCYVDSEGNFFTKTINYLDAEIGFFRYVVYIDINKCSNN